MPVRPAQLEQQSGGVETGAREYVEKFARCVDETTMKRRLNVREGMGTLYLLNIPKKLALRHHRLVTSLSVERWSYLGRHVTVSLALQQLLQKRAQYISITEDLAMTSQTLRGPFLELMGELAQRNSSLLWWSTQLASKSPFTSSVFFYSCLAHVGKKLIQKYSGKGFLLVVDSWALQSHLKSFATQNRVPVRTLTPLSDTFFQVVETPLDSVLNLFRLLKNFYGRRQDIRQRGLLTTQSYPGSHLVLFFTWVDHRNFLKNGTYCDPHFGPLPDYACERQHRIVYIPRVLQTIPFAEALERLQKTDQAFIFPEALLSLSDFFSCFVKVLRYRPVLPASIFLEGVDISGFIQEQIACERVSWGQVTALSYYYLIRNLARMGVIPDLIFFTFEGHNWGYVLYLGVQKFLPKTKVVGFENVTFSRMILSVYPSPLELQHIPLPDRIVTTGPLFHSVLCEVGYPQERLVSGAALRHDYLWRRSRPLKRPAPTNPVRVLVATSIDFLETVELVYKSIRAFAEKKGFELFIKCHPTAEPARVKAEMDVYVQADNVHFVDISVAELLPDAHLLLYTHTVVCYEAVVHGVPPIFVKLENSLNLDKLDLAPECRWVAASAEEIYQQAVRVLNMTDAEWENWYLRARTFTEQVLAPVTPNRLDRFLEPF
jgi:surface carbohydrate biosynthesis protein (TIGR04326 family)